MMSMECGALGLALTSLARSELIVADSSDFSLKRGASAPRFKSGSVDGFSLRQVQPRR